MEQIRYAIVGFGGIAENRIAKEGFALDTRRFNHQDLPMVLVGATDIDAGRKTAATALGLRWYDTYGQILDDDTIDAIYVATSNSTHFPVAMKALQAGKHVLVEKPMTTNLEDANVLCEYALSQGLSVSVNLMMPKNAYNIKARELVRSQAVGPLDYAVLHMEFLYGEDPLEAATWRCAVPDELGGPIGDVASHCLDMAEFLSGQQICSIRCVYYPKTLGIAVEDGALIIYGMQDGTRGCVRVGFNQPRGGSFATMDNLGYELYGRDGVVRGYGTTFQLSGHADEPMRIGLAVKTAVSEESISLDHVQNIYQAQIAEHAHSIRNNKPMDGRQGLHNVALVLACHESARAGGKEIVV
ncbi:MAG: Gfo/Idh/MocA family oxidoreductase [Sphaerochaeta sp.]|nr:Gfo/Idh/MocA family oxidoreductase [Sphaerochaeta sp.]